uniref:Uncharacterized protein n=1 Tax=Chondria sp. (in: red algae) TaxID=1982705 RepID=A0A1Z1MD83_9FLOR|nr:hypothetical protein [Chondria sp. (in: red algae)]
MSSYYLLMITFTNANIYKNHSCNFMITTRRLSIKILLILNSLIKINTLYEDLK